MKGRKSIWKGKHLSDETKRKISEAKRLNSVKRIWINNGLEEKFIPEAELNKYLNDKWVIGRKEFTEKCKQNMSIAGKRTYKNNKNILRKYNEERIEKHSNFSTLNKTAVNNGINTKFIKNENVEKFLSDNSEWRIGSTSSAFKGKKHSEESKKKTSDSLKGRFVGNKNPMYGNHNKRPRQSLAMSGKNNPCYGKRVINNGKISKFVLIEELNDYLLNGWQLGYVKRNKEVK